MPYAKGGPMNIQTSEAFTLNLKMMYNDLAQLRQRADRMWSSVGIEDMPILEQLEQDLENISKNIRNRLDKS